MQICRFCGKLIPTEKPYDPGELWICKECEDKHEKERTDMTGRELIEWIKKNHAEDLQVHIRKTGGEDIEADKPNLKCSIVYEKETGQQAFDKYIMI